MVGYFLFLCFWFVPDIYTYIYYKTKSIIVFSMIVKESANEYPIAPQLRYLQWEPPTPLPLHLSDPGKIIAGEG